MSKKTLYLHGATHQPHRLDFWLKRNQRAAKPQRSIVLQEVQKDFAGRLVVVAVLVVMLDENLNPKSMYRMPTPQRPEQLVEAISAKWDESPSSPKTPD